MTTLHLGQPSSFADITSSFLYSYITTIPFSIILFFFLKPQPSQSLFCFLLLSFIHSIFSLLIFLPPAPSFVLIHSIVSMLSPYLLHYFTKLVNMRVCCKHGFIFLKLLHLLSLLPFFILYASFPSFTIQTFTARVFVWSSNFLDRIIYLLPIVWDLVFAWVVI